MNAGLVEIVGLFLVVVGCGFVIGAAALVSVPLAVLAAGIFVILGGIIAVYVANQLAAKAAAAAPPKAGHP